MRNFLRYALIACAVVVAVVAIFLPVAEINKISKEEEEEKNGGDLNNVPEAEIVKE